MLSGFQHWRSTIVMKNRKVHFVQNFSKIKKTSSKILKKWRRSISKNRLSLNEKVMVIAYPYEFSHSKIKIYFFLRSTIFEDINTMNLRKRFYRKLNVFLQKMPRNRFCGAVWTTLQKKLTLRLSPNKINLKKRCLDTIGISWIVFKIIRPDWYQLFRCFFRDSSFLLTNPVIGSVRDNLQFGYQLIDSELQLEYPGYYILNRINHFEIIRPDFVLL